MIAGITNTRRHGWLLAPWQKSMAKSLIAKETNVGLLRNAGRIKAL
jgi:hypothetical protein